VAQLTKNFNTNEFVCPCCGETKMNAKFMQRLQTFREVMGIPFSPVKGGGYRCESYNKSKTGAHVEGRAIDPNLPKDLLFKAVSVAISVGFTGIGIKNKNGAYQLHLDDAEAIPGKRPRPLIWTY